MPAETMLSLAEGAAAHADTDLAGLAAQIGEHLTDPKCTPAQRLKITRMLFQMDAAARRVVDSRPKPDPETVLRELHSRGQLVAVLRAMLADGSVTLDDLDPPGVV